MRIGIYSPNWIGDSVLAIPFVQLLKKQEQGAEIIIVCKDWVCGVFENHPDVDEIFNRAVKIDKRISVATVYRTVKLFEESGILTKHEFKGGKARYEELNEGHHDHLIDVKTGEIIEFVDEEIEKLQKKVAEKYGYKLVDHKLELYGVKKKSQ